MGGGSNRPVGKVQQEGCTREVQAFSLQFTLLYELKKFGRDNSVRYFKKKKLKKTDWNDFFHRRIPPERGRCGWHGGHPSNGKGKSDTFSHFW